MSGLVAAEVVAEGIGVTLALLAEGTGSAARLDALGTVPVGGCGSQADSERPAAMTNENPARLMRLLRTILAPVLATIPHEDIRSALDRSWSLRLVDLLLTTSGPERDEIVETLARLGDSRTIEPLQKLLEDPEQPPDLRDDVSTILRYAGNHAPSTQLREWWTNGDRLLQRHALLSMGRAEGDIVMKVAEDASHALHRDAIATMMFGFEAPRYQRLKVAALTHADPFVREAAADVLLWDEPAMAENSLAVCTQDADVDVAIAAIKTLRYYSTQRTISTLAGLRDHDDERVRAEATESFAEVRWRFRDELVRLAPSERARLFSWMKPVEDLLAFTPEEIDPPAPKAHEHTAGHDPACGCDDAGANGLANGAANAIDLDMQAWLPPTADELIAIYSDLDGPWAAKLESFPRERDAEKYLADRDRLTPFFLGHVDGGARERACALFAIWGERDALLSLLGDPLFAVRKSAMFWMTKLAPDATLAPHIWAHLENADTSSTHAYETLLTYVVHAPHDEAVPRLVTLVREDEREAVRYHAVYALAKHKATDEIASLLTLLDEPPRVTWGVHLALLDAARTLAIQANIPAVLRTLDHLDVQVELTKWAQE